jgi:hypothetical protein
MFLLKDRRVLQNSDLSVLKVVQADYNPAGDGDSPQHYCGWIATHPGSIMVLGLSYSVLSLHYPT